MTGIIIGIMIAVILIGVPTFFITRVWKSAEKETDLPPEETISGNLTKGFRLMSWGMDLAFGSAAIMIASSVWAAGADDYGMSERLPIAVLTAVAVCMIGFILLFVGRTEVGAQTRILEHAKGRERTPLEDYVLIAMGSIESGNAVILAGQVARMTGNKVDDVAAATAGAGIIFRMRKLSKLFIGNSFFKNHWPLLPVIALTLLFIVLSVK